MRRKSAHQKWRMMKYCTCNIIYSDYIIITWMRCLITKCFTTLWVQDKGLYIYACVCAVLNGMLVNTVWHLKLHFVWDLDTFGSGHCHIHWVISAHCVLWFVCMRFVTVAVGRWHIFCYHCLATFIYRLAIGKYLTGTLLIWSLPMQRHCQHCLSSTGIRMMTLSLLAAIWQVLW